MGNGPPRLTQHKPPRETARGKELAQAKQMIKHLTRQVARLQRRLEKYANAELFAEESPAPTLSESEADTGIKTNPDGSQQIPEPNPNACPCGSEDFTELTTPNGKRIRICKRCKARKTVPL